MHHQLSRSLRRTGSKACQSGRTWILLLNRSLVGNVPPVSLQHSLHGHAQLRKLGHCNRSPANVDPSVPPAAAAAAAATPPPPPHFKTAMHSGHLKTETQKQREKELYERITRQGRATYYLLYIIPAIITLALGMWQTQRYLWKKELIKEREALLEQDVVPLSRDMIDTQENLDKHLYKRVMLTGHFDHEKQLFVGTRQSPEAKREYIASGRAPPNSEQGFYIVAPFITDDGCVVWVNRGWIPRHMKHKWSVRQNSQTASGEASIVGVLREREVASSMVGDNLHVQDDWWLVMEPERFSEHFNIGLKGQVPVLVEQIEDQSPQSLSAAALPKDVSEARVVLKRPSDFVEFYVTPEKHIAYMVTWYGLCAWILLAAVSASRRRTRLMKVATRMAKQQ